MEWKRAFNGILFLAVTVVLMGFAVDSGFAKGQEENPVDLACTDSDIPCSLRCAPAVLKSYSVNGVNFKIWEKELRLISLPAGQLSTAQGVSRDMLLSAADIKWPKMELQSIYLRL